MDESGESREDERGDPPETRGTWFARQLGEGWTEVEPGIYRFDTGGKKEAEVQPPPPADPPQDDLIDALDDLIEVLQPPNPEPEKPTRRRQRRVPW